MRKKIYLVLVFLLALSVIFSGIKLFLILQEYYHGNKVYETIKNTALVEIEEKNVTIDFKKLLEENKDVQGWLYSEDTKINYPVVKGSDNSFYLYRLINKEINGKGSLFIDYRCQNDFRGFNTIIYGHHMKDGSMFASLEEYKNKEYYKKHREMQLITPEERYCVKIFAAATLRSDSILYKWDFKDKEEKRNYIKKIRKDSYIKTDIEVTTKDKIIMLSTCAYDYDNARFVVFGKLTKGSEANKT